MEIINLDSKKHLWSYILKAYPEIPEDIKKIYNSKDDISKVFSQFNELKSKTRETDIDEACHTWRKIADGKLYINETETIAIGNYDETIIKSVINKPIKNTKFKGISICENEAFLTFGTGKKNVYFRPDIIFDTLKIIGKCNFSMTVDLDDANTLMMVSENKKILAFAVEYYIRDQNIFNFSSEASLKKCFSEDKELETKLKNKNRD